MKLRNVVAGMLFTLLVLSISFPAFAVDTTPPVITLVGSSSVTLAPFATYNDAGATATDNIDGVITSKIVTANPVNTSILGTYLVTYNVSDAAGNAAVQKVRTVKVADTTKPVVKINGSSSVTLQINNPYTELGATATDNYDGDITARIVTAGTVNTTVFGTYYITYTATDSSNNTTVAKRTVKVADTIKPVIKLIGSSSMTLQLNSTYTEPGATATDNYDGDLTAQIVIDGTVNTAVASTYTITYTVKDSYGNITVAKRTVKVADTVKPVITILGGTSVTVPIYGTYTELGATATDNLDGDITARIITTGTVDTNVLGTYYITYTVKDSSNNTTVAKRTVRVADTIKPVITLNGDLTVTIPVLTGTYTELGATATDNYNGDLTAQIVRTGTVNTNVVGTYYVSYTVKDTSNNSTTVKRTVKVVDTIKPVITMLGASLVQLNVGSTYVDAGATASDNYNGNLTSAIVTTSTVNTAVAGTYSVKYTVKDSSNNSVTVTRTVKVFAAGSIITVSPAALVYDSQDISAGTSAPLTLTVTNIGNGPLTLTTTGLKFSGTNPGDFVIVNNGIPTAGIAPGGTAPIQVAFDPSAIGVRSAILTINSNAKNSTAYSLNLAGTGTELPIPVITTFVINNDATETSSQTVTLNNVCTGNPTQYMYSESADFTGASWQTYATAPTFTLSSGNGLKTVYFKVKNATGESTVVNDTITLTPIAGTGTTIFLPGNVPLTMVWCPAGTFMMGATANEQDSYPDGKEKPQHQVTFAQGFWMGKYELTKAQWTAVMGTTPWEGQNYVLNDPNSPAVYISWNDAQSFITALNNYAGLTFRLPSEAEWEYACRAGSTTRCYWGDDPTYTEIGKYAWYIRNTAYVGLMYAQVVGQKLPNAWGLYDMIGNVTEGCQDVYHVDYTGAPTDGSAWESPTGADRVGRGCSWIVDYGSDSRSASRGGGSPSSTYFQVGFRLALGSDLPVSAPTITNFSINNDAAATVISGVILNSVCMKSPTQYMASESPDFSGASWQAYTPVPIFMLSAGNGTKTVYFKVKNIVGESTVVSDSITLTENAMTEDTILLPGNVPLTMVWCPAGTFMMGATANEQDSPTDGREKPQHQVTLTRGFWMGKNELTKAQWTALMGTTPWSGQANVIEDSNSPAAYISWIDAQSFITALKNYSGRMFRLPSEAEWEYAARAGTTTRFYWGDDLNYTLIGNHAWYRDNYSNEAYAHAVGQKLSNAWGLYDMSGNVFEWCQDWYGNYGADAVTDPTGPETGIYRLRRGGGWSSSGQVCRSASRGFSPEYSSYAYYGFRLASSDAGIPVIKSFCINNGTPFTRDNVVTLNNVCAESPTQYMASESPDFIGASWQPYAAALTVTLSPSPGLKTVYFKVKNELCETVTVSDTITLSEQSNQYFFANKWGSYGTGNDQFDQPAGIAIDNSGNVYVTDSNNNRIQKFTAEGTYLSQWGTPGTGNGQFQKPSGLAIDASGNIYVADGQNNRIQKFMSDGTFLLAWGTLGTGNGQFAYPSGIAIDALGNVYVVDTGNNRIQKFTADGTFLLTWGSQGTGNSQFNNPIGIAVDASGNVYVADAVNSRIQKFTSTGVYLTQWGSLGTGDGQFLYANNVAVDNLYNDVYVTDYDNHRVQKFTSSGIYLAQWGIEGTGNGQFSIPFGVAVNDLGNVYVTDLVNNRIQMFEYAKAPPVITSFTINYDDTSTNIPAVMLDSICTGGPIQYMASESTDFIGASWQTYSTAASFTLSSGNGLKTVYFKVKNTIGESAIVSDTITLAENAVTEETVLLPGNVPLTMVWCPPGTFMMGATANEQDSPTDGREKPQHQVTLTQGFWMGKYELTKGQWTALTGTKPWLGKANVIDDPNGPAVYVSWLDTQSFLAALNSYTGRTFHLPTEAQWEYACRAGTTTRFYWDDDPNYTQIDNYAWWSGNAGSINETYAHTVGLKLPNAWGLYDMSGNVSEWCLDGYYIYTADAVTDPTPVFSDSNHLRRGGTWTSTSIANRSAYRSSSSSVGDDIIGFRLASSDPGPSASTPSITSFSINGGASSTLNLEMVLTNVCTGNPAQYMASESETFVNASWQPYTTMPTLLFSEGYGTKTVYFKVKNAMGESSIVSDIITLIADPVIGTEETILLPGNVPLTMVWCPPGNFMMGATADEQDSISLEKPQHPVSLTQGFWMGKYELTKLQWMALMGTAPWAGQSNVLNTPNSPAVYISWNDAQAFITALNIYSGLTFRLPTEAQWEYACRAGTTTRFYWSEDLSYMEIGNYSWNYNNTFLFPAIEPYAHIVGQKLPNGWGLYDMSGNVWEFCQDWIGFYSTDTVVDPVGPATGPYRVFRGGGWKSDNISYNRSACRSFGAPSIISTSSGFRLAR